MANRLLFIIIVVIALGVGWVVLQQPDTTFRHSEHVTRSTPIPPTTSVSPPTETILNADQTPPVSDTPIDTSKIAIPHLPNHLDDSDAAAKATAAALSSPLASYLNTDHQIRKWVLVIDLLASGQLPNVNLPFVFNMKKFTVTTDNDQRMWLDEANYVRTNPLIDAFVHIPVEDLRNYYHFWKPLLDQAYAELGKPDTFDSRVQTLIARILAIEPLTTTPELKRPSVYYTFADPELEKADALSKFMWRLGPDNQARIQHYIRQLQPLL